MRRIASIAISFMLAAGCAHSSGKTPYIKPGPSDLGAVLPPPPSPDSQESVAEMNLILRLQETRTADDAKRVKSEIDYDVFAFADVLGPNFNAKECARTNEIFAKVVVEAKPVSSASKEQWSRPRPTVDPRVHALDHEKSFSYPSGHSTRATVYAELLAEAVPSRRDALLERGREIGWDRVIAGIHFPSDVYAGRVLGHAIAQSMLRDPARRREIVEAGEEIRRVCKIGTGSATTMPATVPALAN